MHACVHVYYRSIHKTEKGNKINKKKKFSWRDKPTKNGAAHGLDASLGHRFRAKKKTKNKRDGGWEGEREREMRCRTGKEFDS